MSECPRADPTSSRARRGDGAAGLSACADSTRGTDPSTRVGETRALLDTLDVKGRAPKTGYERTEFGQAWSDDVTVEGGHNGCDTRNDILRRDLTDVTVKPGTKGASWRPGRSRMPTPGRSWTSCAGRRRHRWCRSTTSSRCRTRGRRVPSNSTSRDGRDFANDPRNLQAVGGAVNKAKGDGDAATWLPPDTAYRCTYVARQVEVKAAYGLWVTPAERAAILKVLDGCDRR